MRPLRICLVSREYPPEGIGGVASYVYRLARGLAAKGHDVTVIAGPDAEGSSSTSVHTTSPSPRLCRVKNCSFPLPPPLKSRGHLLWELLKRSWTVDRTIARLEGAQGPFDVVEVPNGGVESLFYCLHPRAPLVIRMSTPLKLSHQFKDVPSSRIGFPLHVFLEALPVRRADCVIVNSRYNADCCEEIYSIPKTEFHVIRHGVKVPHELPAKIESSGKTVRVLYVGRLQRRKGIHLFLKAIPLVAEKMPHVRFAIAGLDTGDACRESSAVSDESGGMTYEAFFKNTATPTAQLATSFLGHVDQATLEQLYTRCDLLVAPSLSESFGLMYAEAMAQGKPVVAFRTGAAPEVVTHKETGILVEPYSVCGLVHAIICLARNSTLRQEMGMRGYRRVRREFSEERMVNETVAVYRKVIAARRKR